MLDPERRHGRASPSRTDSIQHAVAPARVRSRGGASRAHRPQRLAARAFLHALVSGRLSSRQAIDVGPFVDATGQAMRIGFLTVADDVTATATSHRLNFSARTRGCLAAAAEQDGVLLLVEDDDSVTLRSTIHALIESVAPGRWALGVSEPFLDLADARAALDQAQSRSVPAEFQQIAFHDEMGPTVALLKHLPPGATARFVAEILQPLTDYDRERNGALIDTLAAYLRHRGSLRKAAGRALRAQQHGAAAARAGLTTHGHRPARPAPARHPRSPWHWRGAGGLRSLKLRGASTPRGQ